MLWTLLARLQGRSDSGRDPKDESAEEGGDGHDPADSGFLPSRLDASVLFAHGMGNSRAERELASVEEKARVLEESGREDRD